MARGHVRHFAGNREDILTGAARLLYFGEIPGPTAQPAAADRSSSFLPPAVTTIDAALDWLFGAFAEPGPENIAALAFVDAARTIESVRDVIVAAYRSSELELQELLARAAPSASRDEIARTAYSLLAMALGNVFLSDVEVSPERTEQARRTAEVAVAALAASVAGNREGDHAQE
ncbi:hypothetical protein GCM10009792_18160 [Microcella alkalica]